MKKVGVLYVCIIFLTGCSLTRQPSDVSNLQIRMAQLERQVKERDAEIEELKYQIEELGTQQQEVYDKEHTEINFDDKYIQEPPAKSSSVSYGDGEIIRVPVSSKQVQTALKNAGYYSGKIDGKIGDKSKEAIKNFQRDHGLKVDGLIGRNTWAEMKTYTE